MRKIISIGYSILPVLIFIISMQRLVAQPSLTIDAILNTNFQQVQGGNIAAGALLLDADNFFGVFNMGSTIIRKGNSFAMIKANGETVVPFNTYRSLAAACPEKLNNKWLHNGLFSFADDKSMGYIDENGKRIVGTPSDKLTVDKFHFENILQKPYKYIDKSGKIWLHKEQLTNISEGIGITMRSSPKQAYLKISGEVVAEDEFVNSRPFSEGLAMIGKKDQFGVVKYGFMDKSGKVVIPLQFSIPPSDFSSGLARVEPARKDEFQYGFINKKGDLVWKQTQQNIAAYGEIRGFYQGIAITSKGLMDTTFTFLPYAKLYEKIGLKGQISLASNDDFTVVGGNRVLIFSFQGNMNKINSKVRDYGIINLNTGKVVLPCFHLDGTKGILIFDPVSKLAFAKVITGFAQGGVLQVKEGFINEDGKFAITMKEKSTW